MEEYYADKSELNTCKTRTNSDKKQIDLYEVRGLWYILLSGLAVAIGFLIIDAIGQYINSNLRVFSMTGVRAKIDRKIQRRIATTFAIHVAVSIQATNFLTKINQGAMRNGYCLSESIFLKIF